MIIWSFNVAGALWCLFAFTIPLFKDVDADYSYYLGPDYKKKERKTNVSTVISNHQSFLDVPIIYMKYTTTYAAGSFLKANPVLSSLCMAIDCLFMPRGGSDKAREETVQLIIER